MYEKVSKQFLKNAKKSALVEAGRGLLGGCPALCRLILGTRVPHRAQRQLPQQERDPRLRVQPNTHHNTETRVRKDTQ